MATAHDGETVLAVKRAVIAHGALGDNTVIAAVPGRRIRVVALFLVAAAAVTIRWESGAAGTALTGQMAMAANAGQVLPTNPLGWFETAVGALLNLELSVAAQVSGGLLYVEA